MAFVSAQNKIVFNGEDDWRSYGVKVLQLTYKTIVEAATREKTIQERDNNYWFLDSSRASGGSFPSAPDASDYAIYDYVNNSSYAALGMFLKNSAGETMFLTFCSYGFEIGTSQSSPYIYLNPMVGTGTKSDNGHVKRFGSNDIGYNDYYGIGISISKNDFGGETDPSDANFFTDGDLKPVTDSCYGISLSVYNNGETLDIIVAIDGKNIVINRRESYYGNQDFLLIYGDFLSNNDNSDTETDCIFAIQQNTSSYKQLACMFRDKAGSTSFNPNGSNLNNMRRTVCDVNTIMIDGTNSNRIPFTGISFGWQNLNLTNTNGTMNAGGVGYKGLSDLTKMIVVTGNAMITNKSVYSNGWCCIASYTKTGKEFKLLVQWDENNPAII